MKRKNIINGKDTTDKMTINIQKDTAVESKEKIPVDLIGQVSDDQINVWAVKYKEIQVITVENHVGYLRPFTRKEAFLALGNVEINKAMNLEKYARIGEVALLNCWLGGSEKLRSQDDLFVAAAMKAGEMLEFLDADLKKVLPKH